jgi:hypothetical protein
MLTKLGFTSIAVGNAKEDLTQNKVEYKKTVDGVEQYFGNKLSTQFPATYSAVLKETSTYDVVFFIGTDLSGKSPSPAPTSATESETSETTE